jgi:putative zinc finger/helix-turn-helix YgiT family protein
MKSPITGKEMTLKHERRNLVFRKESFEVSYQYYLCEDSGEQFETDELSDINLIQVYNKYREKHKLPFPEEIIAIREKYGVSASRMSEILGFGPNTYRNYEQGEVPASANARLIQLIKDPREFCRLIKLSSISDSKTVDKIIKNAKSLHELRSKNDDGISILLYSGKPNIYNGYSRLKLNKLFELISYFANQIVPWKTQLNKLLFYSDFTCYKKTGYSLTGLQYYAIPRGPVPSRYETIFEQAELDGFTSRIEQELFNGKEGIRYQMNDTKTINLDVFSAVEIDIIKEVIKKYGRMNTSQIIKHSHKEKAWIDNEEERNRISYDYSFDLQIV